MSLKSTKSAALNLGETFDEDVYKDTKKKAKKYFKKMKKIKAEGKVPGGDWSGGEDDSSSSSSDSGLSSDSDSSVSSFGSCHEFSDFE